jgi:hypothetical protein
MSSEACRGALFGLSRCGIYHDGQRIQQVAATMPESIMAAMDG